MRYKQIIGKALIIIAVLASCYGSWRVERWIHWKFAYQGNVDKKIEALSQRMNRLDAHIMIIEAIQDSLVSRLDERN